MNADELARIGEEATENLSFRFMAVAHNHWQALIDVAKMCELLLATRPCVCDLMHHYTNDEKCINCRAREAIKRLEEIK